MLDKLKKQVYRTTGSSVAVSLEAMTLRQNVTSLILLNRYFSVDVQLHQLNWFHFFILMGGPLNILIACKIFLPPFKMSQGCICQ